MTVVFGERPSEGRSAFNPNLGTPTIYPDYVAFQSSALVAAQVRSATLVAQPRHIRARLPGKVTGGPAARFLADTVVLRGVQPEFPIPCSTGTQSRGLVGGAWVGLPG